MIACPKPRNQTGYEVQCHAAFTGWQSASAIYPDADSAQAEMDKLRVEHPVLEFRVYPVMA